MSPQNLDQLCINTIRTLSIDAVQQANSGHPGAPMGLAPVVYSLWQSFLRYDPADPLWPNRDRFVLSAGHASMLLYSTLHLAGVRMVNAQGRSAQKISPFRWTKSSASANSAAARRAIPNRTSPPAWKPPPARSAKAWPTAWAWPSPENGWRRISISPASTFLISASIPSAVMAT